MNNGQRCKVSFSRCMSIIGNCNIKSVDNLDSGIRFMNAMSILNVLQKDCCMGYKFGSKRKIDDKNDERKSIRMQNKISFLNILKDNLS